ncbi:MAG: PorV/PorQ family protein [Elusimicrobiota bacterium]
MIRTTRPLGIERKAAALVLCLLASTSWADTRTGAAFLKIGTGARPEAMGGAYTALSDDVNAMHYNPGGLSLVERRELGFTHTQWLLGSQFDFLGFAQPTRLGMLGLAMTRLGTGSQEARDANRQATGGFSASDSAYALGLGRKLGHGVLGYGSLSLGANVKYLQSKIGSDSASTFALDLGAIHRLDALPLSFGFSVLNMGQGMKFISQRDPLPLTFALGTAYRLGGLLHLALDVRHEPYDKRTEVGVGTEYSVLPVFAVRAGYASQAARAIGSASAGPVGLGGLGGGFGLKLGNYRADYTFTPFGELGTVQRLSLGSRF